MQNSIEQLEKTFGGPSQAAFGTAIFHQPLAPTEALSAAALAHYQYFVGELWARFGEEAWMTPWKLVYSRPAGAAPSILHELETIQNRDTKTSIGVFLDGADNPTTMQVALAAAFDDPAVSELAVYTIGDGEAMSGILITSRFADDGVAIFLTFLLD